MVIINFEKKKMIPLTMEQWQLHRKSKFYYISEKKKRSYKCTRKIKSIVMLGTIVIMKVYTEKLHIGYII